MMWTFFTLSVASMARFLEFVLGRWAAILI
jgi:hypothetical protein